ncbi:Zinc-regulated transporter 2 [Fusarium odoratissimum]|nr:Zinc-regulated transporter 2 [Fusarium odoratissimum]
MFEGLGLGSRLAVAPWPSNRQWMPYLLGCIFALSTPIGIAAGIGAKPNNANDQKLTNGIFDAISAGILMYTGLVELLAHEFMFNPYMRKAPIRILLLAFACVAFGVAVMAILAKWA